MYRFGKLLLFTAGCLVGLCLGLAGAYLLLAPESTASLLRWQSVPPSPPVTLTLLPTEALLPSATSPPTAAPPSETPTAAGMQTARVVQVLDGDTISISIEGQTYRLRYIGIDTPEDGAPFSTEATELNRKLVEGQQVTLEKDVSETDRYGRLLRYVYLADGTLVNAELVRLGFARAVAYPPDTRYQQLFLEKQQEAQQGQLGIWGEPPSTPTPIPVTPGIPVIIDPACSQFNAPGDDNTNKNEEYLCLSNPSNQPTDLSGWSVHDTYGWSYLIPPFSLAPGASVRLRTGCGTNAAQDLYWCRGDTAIWNNGGDCASLLDGEGLLIQKYCY